MSWVQIGFLLFAIITLWSDVRKKKIPNGLLAAGAAAAWFLPFADGSGHGEWYVPCIGAAIGGLVALPLYALKAVRSGYVKWFAAAGAFLGPWEAALLPVGTVMAAGAAAVLAACVSRSFRQRCLETAAGVYIRSGSGRWTMPEGTGTPFPLLACAVPVAAWLQFMY